MHHPYQAISEFSRDGNSFLLGASGSNLLSINLIDGIIASRWPSGRRQDPNKSSEEDQQDSQFQGPPSKRQKVEQVNEEPSITKIATSPDGTHAVVVTAEDKCIRVFSIAEDGALEQISQRCMSKRPSAVTLIDNGHTIISADKFGDVYSLPLLPSAEEEAAAKLAAQQNAKSLRVKASETTVHSEANRKTLENQRKQAEKNLPIKTKESMEFSHSFLLGHISMITDIISAQIPSSKDGSVRRTHLLTADRDEHIRISRGPPQSFVIERYCLGHKEYISKLCLISDDILVSGGGDDDLFVWDLKNGNLLGTVSIRAALEKSDIDRHQDSRIAVSGLWLCPAYGEIQAQLIVALEGQPILLHCDISTLTTGAVLKSTSMSGNLLDVAIVDGLVIASVDNIHTPGSTKDINADTDFKARLQVINLCDSNCPRKEHLQHQLVESNGAMATEWHEKKLQSLLYSTESLRKRQDAEEAEGELAEE